MINVINLNAPTPENTLRNPDSVVITPVYAKKDVLARMYGMSGSTVSRLVERAKKDGIDNIAIRVSMTQTIYHIEGFENYLKSIDSKFL